MNFGEKFPYALLTFSQKFVEAGYWVHLIPKTCQVDCSTHAHLLPKVCRSWLLGTLHPNHYPHAQLHINPIPHTPYTPYTHTNYTPTIHNPTTPPIPLLLRVDSDEMRQKPAGFYLMRCWTARKGPRMGPKVHEVDSALARAQTKVDEVYGPYGSSPNPAKFAPSPSKFPQTLQYFRKSHKQ